MKQHVFPEKEPLISGIIGRLRGFGVFLSTCSIAVAGLIFLSITLLLGLSRRTIDFFIFSILKFRKFRIR